MQAQQQLYLAIIIARNSGASLILQAICYTFPVALLLHIYLYIQHGCTCSSLLAYHVSLHPVLIIDDVLLAHPSMFTHHACSAPCGPSYILLVDMSSASIVVVHSTWLLVTCFPLLPAYNVSPPPFSYTSIDGITN
jgi:hypothetical protein